MSLLLNTMEKHVAEIFSYYNSSCELWKAMLDMYGNQNNYACVFQLKNDIASAQQEGKVFVQHLGRLKAMWNALDVYLPHTTDLAILLKRAEEDKIYQLLGSLNSEYKDLRRSIEFAANSLSLINEFAAYLQSKGHGGGSQAQGNEENNHAAMLGQFAGFLAGNEKVSRDEALGQANELFEMFPLHLVINNPVLEESSVAVTPDIEEIQPDSISDHRISANEGDEESCFDHSQSPTES
ncbi:unnamed protein product [Malus baccata var. baccata]